MERGEGKKENRRVKRVVAEIPEWLYDLVTKFSIETGTYKRVIIEKAIGRFLYRYKDSFDTENYEKLRDMYWRKK